MTLPLLRRPRSATPIPVASITAPSRHYGLADLERRLAASQAHADRLASDLRRALAELAIRPAPDPLLRRLAVDGPASTDVLAAELGLTAGEVAVRLGHAVTAGRVGCVDAGDAMIWHLLPTEEVPQHD